MVVYIGDCISGMRSRIQSESIDLIIADPPFGISFDKIGKGSTYERNDDLVVDGYVEVPRERYGGFTNEWLSQAYRCLKRDGSMYIFSGWSNLLCTLSAIERAGFVTINHIIWRYQFGVFTKRRFTTSHYHVLFVVKDESKYHFYKKHENEYVEDVWVFQRPYIKDEIRYPTKLPPSLVQKCIRYSSRENDIVMDIFLGSGTTALVAASTNRRFVGFEKNDKCIEIYRQIIGEIECLKT